MNAKITVSSFKNFVKAATSVLKNGDNVLVHFDTDYIEAVGASQSASIKARLTANADNAYENVDEPTDVFMKATMLKDCVAKLPDGLLGIVFEDGILRLNAGGVKFKLNTLSEAAPDVEFTDKVDSEMEYGDLLRIMNSVGFAASTKPTRPILTGIHYHVDAGLATFVATDSYRLAKLVKAEADAEKSLDVTIPAAALSTALSVFKGVEDKIGIAYFKHKIQFSTQSVVLQMPVLDGNYPETDRLIPQQFITEFTCDRKELLNAVDRSTLMKEDTLGSTVRLSIKPGENLEIRARNYEIGEYNDTVYLKNVTGEELTISLMSSYLIQALKSIDDMEVRVQCSGEMKPLIIKGLQEGDVHCNLLLPVRTRD